VAIKACPVCGEPLSARRESWFVDVVIGPDGNLMSATPKAGADDVWRVYCQRGHEMAAARAWLPVASATPPPADPT